MGSPKPYKHRRNINREWLKKGGEEIPTDELKEICKTWDQNTWEAYLKWYEAPSRETQVHPYHYEIQLERLQSGLFEDALNQQSNFTSLCENLVSSLPVLEKAALGMHYLEGLTDIQVAPVINRSRRRTQELRIQGLTRLGRGNPGDEPPQCHLMRRMFFTAPKHWESSKSIFIKKQEDLSHESELSSESVTEEFLKAFKSLSNLKQRILFQRFWKDEPLRKIARDHNLGRNTLDDLLTSALNTLKREFLKNELGQMPGERNPYAPK